MRSSVLHAWHGARHSVSVQTGSRPHTHAQAQVHTDLPSGPALVPLLAPAHCQLQRPLRPGAGSDGGGAPLLRPLHPHFVSTLSGHLPRPGLGCYFPAKPEGQYRLQTERWGRTMPRVPLQARPAVLRGSGLGQPVAREEEEEHQTSPGPRPFPAARDMDSVGPLAAQSHCPEEGPGLSLATKAPGVLAHFPGDPHASRATWCSEY